MLKSLQIKNYILIRELDIQFDAGFCTITGETGAGKSILLGAINLLLGQRADTSWLLDKNVKCVVEGTFDISGLGLEAFFASNDIDYENQTIIRREILETGKSRAFINDVPVNLQILKELGENLIDIHSQHQGLLLNKSGFQLKMVDSLASNRETLANYKQWFEKFQRLNEELRFLRDEEAKAMLEHDYNQFQFDELEKAKLSDGELAELETEFQQLTHAEEIKTALFNVSGLLSENEINAIQQLKDSLSNLVAISHFSATGEELMQRLEAIIPELKDVAFEASRQAENVIYDPEKISVISARLDLLHHLMNKHRVESVNQLIDLREQLALKISKTLSFGQAIEKTEKELDHVSGQLKILAGQLSKNRHSVKDEMQKTMTNLLQELGIPSAVFQVSIKQLESLTAHGADEISFLFSANRNIPPMPVDKIASGGEISRLMLALKYLVANKLQLPAVIFDEIDAGVSGEIADKMALLMLQMSYNMQIISITHLPQIASKGNSQYHVFKTETEKATLTQIKRLDKQERIHEIARMLSGSDVSQAAYDNAMELLMSTYEQEPKFQKKQ